MAATTVGITGSGPLAVTDKQGAQRVLPLSAFEMTGSKVALKAAWSTLLAPTIDTTLVNALATDRLASGDLAAPPAPRVSLAIMLTAASAGTEGNGITVVVTPDGLDDVTLAASQTLLYPGLSTGASAEAAIGDATGTGPVKVTAVGAGTKPAKATNKVVKATKTLDIADTDGTLLATLTNTAADDVTIDVRADTDPTKFVVQLDRGPLTSTKVKLTALAADSGAASKLVTAAAPPTGLAVPAAATLRLSGGTDTAAASGAAYTG